MNKTSTYPQKRSTQRVRLRDLLLTPVCLVALHTFSATAYAQAISFSAEVSSEASTVVADNVQFSPPLYEYKGWFDPETYELRTFTPSSTLQVFDLIPADENDVEWPGLRALKTRRAASGDYYISYSQQPGIDNSSSADTNAVRLHWSDGSGDSYFQRMIGQGDVFADAKADLVVWGGGSMTIDNPEYTDDTQVFALKVCNTTCSTLVPPVNLAANEVYADSTQLTWQDYTHNEDGFTVEYSADGSTWRTLGKALEDAVSYVHSGQNTGKHVYYRVRAYRGATETSDWSYIDPANDTGGDQTIVTEAIQVSDIRVSVGGKSESGDLGSPQATVDPALPAHFVTTWQTDRPGTSSSTSITIPMVGGPYDVDWDNDGTFDELGLTGPVTHDYEVVGTQTVSIRGVYESISFSNGGDKEKLLSLDQWGTNAWTSMNAAFHGCENLSVAATDIPDFSLVSSMRYMFYGATSAKPDVSSWNVSSVTNMNSMFGLATSANPDVGNWDTSSVIDMGSMFSNATRANPNVSGWDTSSVAIMSSMFSNATSANPVVSNWDTSSVTNMSSLFSNATSANPDVSSWNTSSVNNMRSMFASASAANPDVSLWDTSSVTNMGWMFVDAASANPDVSLWDTSSVNNMIRMFGSTSVANPDVSGWDTSSVTDMSSMFSNAVAANPDVSGWDTSSVASMVGMFEGAVSANPDVVNWDTSSVTNVSSMFSFAVSFDRDLGSWDMTSVTAAANMLNGVTLSTTNYDNLLVGWNDQELQSGVYFSGGNSKHCSDAAVDARADMVALDAWVITDGGYDCTPSFIMNAGLNDAWFDPVTNGQGFFVTVFPGIKKVYLSWFTYDTEQPGDGTTANLGAPGHRWLTALGDYSSNRSEMEISIASGGVFDTQTDISRVEDGTIVLTFTGCNAGTVEYDIPSINLQRTVPIERVVAGTNIALCESMSEPVPVEQVSSGPDQGGAFKLLPNDVVDADEVPPLTIMNAGLNDAWFDPVTNGQGFFVTVFPGIQKVYLSWFTYDTERPAEGTTANLGDPGHRWLTALGDYTGTGSEMEISIASGGIFDTQTDISRVEDGTITLNFTDCNTGTVEYDIPSINQQRTVPIERVVAGTNIGLCESMSEPVEN